MLHSNGCRLERFSPFSNIQFSESEDDEDEELLRWATQNDYDVRFHSKQASKRNLIEYDFSDALASTKKSAAAGCADFKRKIENLKERRWRGRRIHRWRFKHQFYQ